jgi:EmrB/QacA subfamily drug resistance transporter
MTTLVAESGVTRKTDPRHVVFGGSMLAIFMASVEATIVATAMPTIVADLGGLKLFAWVFGVYFLTQAITTPIYGRLSDLYGRKRLLFVAIAVFLLGSIACGFARSMTFLIIFRALQGLGAGGIGPVATTIVGDIYTTAERAKYQGYLSSTWGVSALIGPLLGAFLLQRLSWSAIFWINVPVGILCVIVFAVFYHEHVVVKQHRIDYLGSLLLMLGIGTLMLELLLAKEAGALLTASMSAVVVIALVVLVWHELRTPEPMLPLRLLRIRVIAIANIGCFVVGATVMGVSAFLPTYVQTTMKQPALVGGLALGAQSLFWTFGSIIGGRVMLRTSYRFAAGLGGCALLVGAAMLIALEPARGPWWAGAGSAMLGLGFGMSNSTFLISTQAAVEREQRGAATASMLFMRNFGQAIGTAVLGAVFSLSLTAPATIAGLAAAVHNVYLVTGLFTVAIFILTWLLPRGLSPTRHGLQTVRE